MRCLQSPDGKAIASGSWQEIRMWDAATGEHRQTLTGHASLVKSLAFSPDGGTLVSGGEDGTIFLWQLTPLVDIDTGVGVEPLAKRTTTLGNIKRNRFAA